MDGQQDKAEKEVECELERKGVWKRGRERKRERVREVEREIARAALSDSWPRVYCSFWLHISTRLGRR